MIAYISQNADNRIIESLRREGFEVHLLAPFDALTAPTNTHADMLLLSVGDTVFVHKDYPVELSDVKNVVKIDEPIGSKYPSDVRLNIAIVGKNAICNTKYASRTILNHLKNQGYEIAHVPQGYAHCSTCIVSTNALITADESIFEAAKMLGIDALKIVSGHISLPPYDYGFIGGASGTDENKVYFCGSLSHHPDGEKIREFIKKHGKDVCELTPLPLEDIGGMLLI